jgi:CubicO group peptidase (beta-lactamase class C family)
MANTALVCTLPLLVSLVAGCAPPAAHAPSRASASIDQAPVSGTPAPELAAYLRRVGPLGVAGVFLVARDDRVLVHEGVGLADRESAVRFGPETVFDIGSITKQFTAAGILKLEEQGKLSVEDSISRFFAGVPVDKRGITVHHLLTHTSGLIGDFGGDYQTMPRDSIVRLALASELQSVPGAAHDYSNAGYSLLGAIIELQSGQPYERFLHEQLFRPAGMHKTGYVIPQWSPGELAAGYRGEQRWGTPLDHAWATDGPWWNLRANGGILSTTSDLHRWHRALEGNAVLSAASRAKMFTPHVSESPGGDASYGYGWAVFRTPRNTRLIAHNGGNGYFYADFHQYVDEGVVLILGTNAGDQSVTPVVNRLLAAVFDGKPPRLPPEPREAPATAELQRYVGAYALAAGDTIIISVNGGQLIADAAGQGAVELLHGGNEQRAESHRLTELARAVMDGAARGDATALQAASATPDRALATLQRVHRTAEQNFGPHRSTEVLGTVRNWWSGTSELVTFVRLNFERGGRILRLHWADGRITGFGGTVIPNPARTTLLAQGDHSFIGYNLGIEHEVPLRFEVASDGVPTTVRILAPDGERIATRRP